MHGADDYPHQLSEVLVEEVELIKGPTFVTDAYGTIVNLPQAVETAGSRVGPNPKTIEDERRRTFYFWAHRFNLSALCLSGGGIRSASFALGVIQALADGSLLKQFDYLSTVSGGGYIGSWLSAWLYRNGDADDVIRQLRSRREAVDAEPGAITHLRDYSNYLTPRLCLFSADTWSAVAIILRNLLINWLILLPAIALVVVAVKLLAAILILQSGNLLIRFALALACLGFGSLGLGYKLYRLYSPELIGARRAQNQFIRWSLVPILASSSCFAWFAVAQQMPVDFWSPVDPSTVVNLPTPSWFTMFVFALMIYAGALAGAFIRVTPFGSGVLFGEARAFAMRWRDVLAWAAGVAVFGTLIWLGAMFLHRLPADVNLIKQICVRNDAPCVANPLQNPISLFVPRDLLIVIVGIPWFFLATLVAQDTYLLLRSDSVDGEVDREWLGRAAGWHFIIALGWVVLSTIVLLGPALYHNIYFLGQNAGSWLTALTGVSGAITALLGKSSLTAKTDGAKTWPGLTSNIVLAIAGSLFVVLLLILLSVVTDLPFLGPDRPMYSACFPSAMVVSGCQPSDWIAIGVVLAAITAFADFFANVNRFSIHALYRNRLVRAFLGGSRVAERRPDGFTGFDWNDDLRVARLWHDRRPEGRDWRPFHVINMTLNLASTKRLAWQQRKGSSFVVTPKFCGVAELGYRITEKYGNPNTDGSRPSVRGMSLGTAMAISGAAVSSNMGYHTSPSLAFLLTLFNVRLGWWLGNPGRAGDRIAGGGWRAWLKRQLNVSQLSLAPYKQEGPWFALKPLLEELLGLTSDESPYVYLSDGGHFENFGLYEMVRRRCRWIVVCDGAEDHNRTYQDLGNAVRKIWIDLGVRISFDASLLLQADKATKPLEMPYFALGTIDYVSDGALANQGKILYIKPAVRGDESAADVIAYQRLHTDFPQQSTGEQWFDESQLESYRALGYLIINRILAVERAAGSPPDDLAALFAGLRDIDPRTLGLHTPAYDEA